MDGLTQYVLNLLIKGSTQNAVHTADGLVATMNNRWRGFALFGVVLFATVLIGLGFYWQEIWAPANLQKKIMVILAIPWMSSLIIYMAIIPRNWRLVITPDGIQERRWTPRYDFTPWSKIASVSYEATRNNVIFRRFKGRKIEIGEMTNGFEEIKAFAMAAASRKEV